MINDNTPTTIRFYKNQIQNICYSGTNLNIKFNQIRKQIELLIEHLKKTKRISNELIENINIRLNFIIEDKIAIENDEQLYKQVDKIFDFLMQEIYPN